MEYITDPLLQPTPWRELQEGTRHQSYRYIDSEPLYDTNAIIQCLSEVCFKLSVL